jgi:hypothetical protein
MKKIKNPPEMSKISQLYELSIIAVVCLKELSHEIEISFVFFVLQRAFFYFLCTVSGCDGGNRIHNIAVYTWRFSLLSYDRHPLSYDRHPLSYDGHPSPSPFASGGMEG